jgi:hypothetical protein
MTPEQDAAFRAIRDKQVELASPIEPVVQVEQGTPEPSSVVTEATPADTPVTEIVTETPAVEPVVESPTSWDESEVPATSVVEAKIDFSKIGSALNLPDLKSEDEVVAKVTELKTQLKSYEENAYQGIPDDFKEVIKVSKVGDWKEYLANDLIDYTKLDPVIEYENEFLSQASRNPKYYTDGVFDPAKAEEALETIPDAFREAQGNTILNAKAQVQHQRKIAMQQAAEAKINHAEKTLTAAAKNLNELLPFESYGIKFEPKHSTEIMNGIITSKLTRKHLGVSYEDLIRSGADMKAVAATVAKAEYSEKMLKFKAGASKAEAKKELLSTMQNPQIRTTGTVITPTDTSKAKSAAQKIADWKAETNRGF